ncbi:MAG: alpha/beta fold hydrolase [Bacteroidota bacterium]
MKNNLLFLILLTFFWACDDDDTTIPTNPSITENAKLPSDLPSLYRQFYEDNGGLNYVTVNGSKMAYTDSKTAAKPVMVLLHGLPDNNFLYRDVIPELKADFRVIAPDHIGYGLSDRPDLEYSFTTLSNYLEGFVKELNLTEIHLVVTDVGGPAGLGFAARNPDLISSITMYETLWLPVDDLENSNYAPPFQEFLINVRTPEVGEEIVVAQNQMLAFLNQLTVSEMSDAVQEVYAYPWLEEESRTVMLETSRSIPVAGDPADSKAMFDNYGAYLTNNNVPKLVILATPGAISPPDYVDTAVNTFANIQSATIEEVGHFITEDKPVEFANVVADFIENL